MRPRPTPVARAGESLPLSAAEVGLTVQTLALVVFSSWAFGGVHAWAQEWILGLAVAGLPLMLITMRGEVRATLWALLPLAGWLCFLGIALANPSHEPGASGGWLPRPGWIRWLPTTVDRAHTLAEAPVWIAVLLQAAVLHRTLRHERAVRIIWAGIALNGFALAAVGGVFHFNGEGKLPGMDAAPAYSFATFYYKNHWAAFGALAALASLGLALRSASRALAGDPPARQQVLVFSAAALLTLTTLPLPGSRSGVLLAGVILLGAAIMALRKILAARGVARRWRAWLLTSALAAAGVVALGVDAYLPQARLDLAKTRDQIERRTEADPRPAVSRDTWRMAQARPWFGWGPGTFEVVFPIFQGDYFRDAQGKPIARFKYAHDDWLQLLAEAGIVGALWWLVPMGWLAWRAWRTGSTVARWGLFGCGLIAGYAWFDFPFHNPAVLIVWTVMLTTAQRWRASGGEPSLAARA